MNFLNRAIKNSTRKMSKTVLLALTFFVIGNFVIVGLGISNAAEQAQVQTRMKMRAVLVYEADYQKFYEDAEDEDYETEDWMALTKQHLIFSEEEIADILADDRVKAINAVSPNVLYSDGFEAVPIGNERENENMGTSMSCYVDQDGVEVCEEHVWVDPNIRGMGNAYPDMIEFQDGMFEMVEGRMYTQEEIDNGTPVALITDTLAAHNNLRVGDTITLAQEQQSSYDSGGYYGSLGLTYEESLIELEIIGIFNNLEEVDPTTENFDWMSPYESPENIVLYPDSAVAKVMYELQLKLWESNKLQYPDDEYYQNDDYAPTLDGMLNKTNLTILLSDPLKVEGFYNELLASIEEEELYRTVDANNEVFEELSRPLETIGLFANFIVWLVVINAIIIITLVTALTLKTREYEIGVLLSQGVTKFKIVAQFFVELALVAVIGFTVAIASGMMIAGQVGETVLSYQVDSSGLNEEQEDDYYYGGFWGLDGYFTDIELDDIVSEYEVEISPIIILQIYVAGLGIVLISILIPSMMVMRFNPKRILMSSQ